MKNFKIMEHKEFGKVKTMVDEKGRVLFCGNENKFIVVTKWTQAGRLLIHEIMTDLRMEDYQMSFDFSA